MTNIWKDHQSRYRNKNLENPTSAMHNKHNAVMAVLD